MLSAASGVASAVGVKAGSGVGVAAEAGKAGDAEAAVSADARLLSGAVGDVIGAKGAGSGGTSGEVEFCSAGSVSPAAGPATGEGSTVGVRVGSGKGWSRWTRAISSLSDGAANQNRVVPAPSRLQTNRLSSRPDSGRQARKSPQRGCRRTGPEIARLREGGVFISIF